MDYSMTDLVGWTRRHSGDSIRASNENIVSDGSATITLNTEGYIAVTKITVDSQEMDAGDYTTTGNIITFNDNLEEGASVTVFYNSARYSDDEVKDFLADAARGVAADMKFRWRVDRPNFKIVDDRYQIFYRDSGEVIDQVEQLLVYRAGSFLYADKTNQAADDAIKIRDGETTIDTAATAGASEKALNRLVNLYKQAVLTARSEGFMGSAVNEEA